MMGGEGDDGRREDGRSRGRGDGGGGGGLLMLEPWILYPLLFRI